MRKMILIAYDRACVWALMRILARRRQTYGSSGPLGSGLRAVRLYGEHASSAGQARKCSE